MIEWHWYWKGQGRTTSPDFFMRHGGDRDYIRSQRRHVRRWVCLGILFSPFQHVLKLDQSLTRWFARSALVPQVSSVEDGLNVYCLSNSYFWYPAFVLSLLVLGPRMPSSVMPKQRRPLTSSCASICLYQQPVYLAACCPSLPITNPDTAPSLT